jgi:pimeloyl-ACP methyl ester carboxylesterase
MNICRSSLAAGRVTVWSLLLVLAALSVMDTQTAFGQSDVNWHSLVDNHKYSLDVGGFRVGYYDIGTGSPVVLLHGFWDSSYCWHNNVQALLDSGHRVILVDLPGLGSSEEPPGSYTLSVENLSSTVMRVVNHLGLKRFSLVGSSMGGGMCLYLALNEPVRVAKVVVFAPTCYHLPVLGSHIWLRLPLADLLAPMMTSKWGVRYGLKDLYYIFDKVDEVLVSEYYRALNKPGTADLLVRLYSQYFSKEFDRMTTCYKEFAKPLLIVWGDHDGVVPLDYGEALQQEIPKSMLKIVKCSGHIPYQEWPDMVNPMLVEFLDSRFVKHISPKKITKVKR